MTITDKPIAIFISEQEADILQYALAHYDGPYKDIDRLTDEELARREQLQQQARGMAIQIQQLLLDRYHDSQQQESEFFQAAERASQEVARWPAWRREGYSAATRGKVSR